MSASKSKGTAAETAIVRFLIEHGFPYAERRCTSGANDRGDIGGIVGWVIEVKNCSKMALAAWIDEAELEARNANAFSHAVWHKRRGTTDPAHWYVTMPGWVFTALLRDDQAGVWDRKKSKRGISE